jgi:aromatic ring-opening dioxygenase catalytic subunit (LigB family)
MDDTQDQSPLRTIGRRQTLGAILAVASGVAEVGSVGNGAAGSRARSGSDEVGRKLSSRMPVVFLPHGGGPWPFVDTGIGDPEELRVLSGYLRSIRDLPKTPPRALLVISAHWEERVPTLMTSAHPPMLYDYYGFPPESYQVSWPAPGEPVLAQRVRELLARAGFPSAEEPHRGFDHGTFVPLKLTYPEAHIPTLQLSLVRSLDPSEHLALGRALEPLRDEGVLIIGSGMTFHNLRAFGAPGQAISKQFDDWLVESVPLENAERDRRLKNWSDAPSARAAHPREEHLLPLMVIAGAAGTDRATVAWRGTILSCRLSAFHFG